MLCKALRLLSTKTKLNYLQSVVDVGFDIVDIGSFVLKSDTSII